MHPIDFAKTIYLGDCGIVGIFLDTAKNIVKLKFCNFKKSCTFVADSTVTYCQVTNTFSSRVDGYYELNFSCVYELQIAANH